MYSTSMDHKGFWLLRIVKGTNWTVDPLKVRIIDSDRKFGTEGRGVGRSALINNYRRETKRGFPFGSRFWVGWQDDSIYCVHPPVFVSRYRLSALIMDEGDIWIVSPECSLLHLSEKVSFTRRTPCRWVGAPVSLLVSGIRHPLLIKWRRSVNHHDLFFNESKF